MGPRQAGQPGGRVVPAPQLQQGLGRVDRQRLPERAGQAGRRRDLAALVRDGEQALEPAQPAEDPDVAAVRHIEAASTGQRRDLPRRLDRGQAGLDLTELDHGQSTDAGCQGPSHRDRRIVAVRQQDSRVARQAIRLRPRPSREGQPGQVEEGLGAPQLAAGFERSGQGILGIGHDRRGIAGLEQGHPEPPAKFLAGQPGRLPDRRTQEADRGGRVGKAQRRIR